MFPGRKSKYFFLTFAGMKRWFSIIVLVLMLALAACDGTTNEARRMVKRAERLADTLPDSTARLVDSVLRMPVNFRERERMDMALLQAEALFGDRGQEISPVMDDDFFDDRGNLSTSPELERAAAYYARKEDYAKAAHAALYSGFVQQHYDEKEAAMRSFKEAEQYGMMAGDSLTVARAEYWMGKHLIYGGMEQKALSLLKKAENGFDSRCCERALGQNLIAACYLIESNYKDAETYLHISLMHAEKCRSAKIKLKVLNNYAVLYRQQGFFGQAVSLLRQMANEPGLDVADSLFLYLNLGKVFMAEGALDSATASFNHLDTLLTQVTIRDETKTSAYEALSNLAQQQGDLQKAFHYKKKREETLSKLLIQRQNQNIFRIQQQYDYESLQNELNRKIIKRHVVILVTIILLLVATTIVLILQHKQKELLKAEEETKQQMDAMKQDLRQMVKTSDLDHEISSLLRTIMLAKRTAQRAKDPQKEWRPLVTQIINDEQDSFKAACRVLETLYPNLYSTILKNHPDLTETEAKICLLSCSDLSNAEIAELLGLRTNTVNQNRSNLRKKLNLNSDKLKDQLRDELS